MRYLSPPGDTGACERVGAEQGREGVLEVEVQHSMATSTTEVAHAHASIPIEKPAPLRAELPTIAGAQI
jgi:hypothetical protein